MMDTISYVKAGTALLAAAMRDPEPLVNLDTFWQFMRVVEAETFMDTEKATVCYQHHVACYDRIYQLRYDMTSVGDDLMQLGPRLIEAFAAYAAQAADLLAFLIEHRPASSLISFMQSLEEVMRIVVREVMEMPHSQEVDLALDLFKETVSLQWCDFLPSRDQQQDAQHRPSCSEQEAGAE